MSERRPVNVSGWILVAVALWLGGLAAGEEPAGGAAQSAAPTVWSLSGQGDGVSKVVPVERDGRKLQVLYANGGNTLAVQLAAKAGDAAGAPTPGDRLTLKCELLLAEYDETSRQIERLLCAGHVTANMVSTSGVQMGTTASQKQVQFSAESLVFQNSFTTPENSPLVTESPLGLLRGVWTLRNDRPPFPDVPTEFAQWLQALPKPNGERVLLTSDRLTLLAPQVTFDPVAGHCQAGPEQVTGSFAPEPPATGTDKDTAEGGRSVAWSPARRTVFSGRELSGDFIFDRHGLRPADNIILTGDVCLYQPPTGTQPGTARLTADQVAMNWPRGPAHTMPPRLDAWRGYEQLQATGSPARPVVLQDGDLTIRGGAVDYRPATDTGTLKPVAGEKFAVNEMNLPPDAAHPERGSPGRIRMLAEGFQFHLRTRDFAATGERVMEHLPAEPAPRP